jgi:CubicO group peptidase (beta-lactamase class C family)
MVDNSISAELVDSTPQEAGFYPDQLDLIRQRGHEWVAAGRANSLVLLLARRGKVAFLEGFGPQGRDDPTPVDLDSVYHCASVAKVLTATAVMILVERGELSLNRPVQEYLPEMRGKYHERMMVHQLLTHTSGLAELEVPPLLLSPPSTEVPRPEGLAPLTHAQLQYLFQKDCHKKPGEQNIYASVNFILLGEIIRRVSGQDIQEFSAQNIFTPLGMNHSTFASPSQLGQIKVGTFDRLNWPFPTSREQFINTPNGAGSFKCSARDLAIFGQTFLNGGSYADHRLLNDWTVKQMTCNQISGVGTVNHLGSWIPEASWGLGWMVQGDAWWPWSHGTLQPVGTYYHQGASGCSLWVDPIHDLVGVYLSSVDRDMADPDPKWEFDKFQNMATAALV